MAKLPLMGFVYYVRTNIAKYLPYPVETKELKVVNQHDVGEEQPFLGLVLPGDGQHEAAMINLLEGYEKVVFGTPVETVMRQFAEV